MNGAIVAIPLLILILLASIAVPVMLGVFVYRDAKSRGMEPLLWALLAVLVPSFVGLIIYLVVRKDHIVMNCPKCGGEVQEHFTACPSCGQKLKAGCSNCGTALKPEWKICPQCGSKITATENIASPVINKGNKNKGMLGIILAIIAVPLLVILLAIFGIIGSLTYNTASDSHVDDETVAITEKFRSAVDFTDMEIITMEDMGDVLSSDNKKWIDECKNGKDGIYSKTVYQFRGGSFNSDTALSNDEDGMWGNYEIVYAYTIIVVNSPYGKACNFQNGEVGVAGYESIDDNGIVPENMAFTLNEVKDYDQYNNVFIVKSLYSCKILDEQLVQIYSDKMQSQTIMLSIVDQYNWVDYKIPVEETENYVKFDK